MRESGKVAEIEEVRYGSVLPADVATASGTLTVENAGFPFSESGGSLVVEEVDGKTYPYGYAKADPATGVITLSAGVTTSQIHEAESLVYTDPPVIERVAHVEVSTGDETDPPVLARVPRSLYDRIEVGVSVVIEKVGAEWVVFDAPGDAPSVDGAFIGGSSVGVNSLTMNDLGNLVEDPSFESGVIGPGEAWEEDPGGSGLGATGDGPEFGIVDDPAGAKHGQKYLRRRGGAAANLGRRLRNRLVFECERGDRFYLRAWGRVLEDTGASSVGRLWVGVVFYDRDGVEVGTSWGIMGGGSAYERKEFELQTPANDAVAYGRVAVESASNDYEHRIDKIYATLLSPASRVPVGTFIHAERQDSSDPSVGIPLGYLRADGSIHNVANYPELAALYGNRHGGDGINTFGVPNIKGRVLVGLDSAQTEFDALGEAGGAKTHQLTLAEIPEKQHGVRHVDTTTAGGGSKRVIDVGGASGAVGGTLSMFNATGGGGGSHNNLQPYRVANVFVKY